MTSAGASATAPPSGVSTGFGAGGLLGGVGSEAREDAGTSVDRADEATAVDCSFTSPRVSAAAGRDDADCDGPEVARPAPA